NCGGGCFFTIFWQKIAPSKRKKETTSSSPPTCPIRCGRASASWKKRATACRCFGWMRGPGRCRHERTTAAPSADDRAADDGDVFVLLSGIAHRGPFHAGRTDGATGDFVDGRFPGRHPGRGDPDESVCRSADLPGAV